MVSEKYDQRLFIALPVMLNHFLYRFVRQLDEGCELLRSRIIDFEIHGALEGSVIIAPVVLHGHHKDKGRLFRLIRNLRDLFKCRLIRDIFADALCALKIFPGQILVKPHRLIRPRTVVVCPHMGMDRHRVVALVPELGRQCIFQLLAEHGIW